MKLTTYVQNLTQLMAAYDAGADEVILGHRDFSRFGKLSTEEFIQLSREAQKLKLPSVFEWDILMTENVFEKKIELLKTFPLEYLPLIRVQDPGALEWCLDSLPQSKIQLNLETGHHNMMGIRTWANYVGERLDRLILSIELPGETLASYIAEFGEKVEFLLLGRILLFYTPRSLLTPFEGAEKIAQHDLEVLGESEESPHKGFPIVENRHGTFMFHIKDHCLLEVLPELFEMNLSWGRVDFRFNDFNLKGIQKVFSAFSLDEVNQVKVSWGNETLRGFYHVNKSDVLFKKLKNHRIQRRDENYLGEILEIKKGEFLALSLANPLLSLKLGQRIRLLSPEGEEKEVIISKLLNTALGPLEDAHHGQVVLINFVGSMGPRTVVYQCERIE